jgi:threonine-phosphate decarboxylase
MGIDENREKLKKYRVLLSKIGRLRRMADICPENKKRYLSEIKRCVLERDGIENAINLVDGDLLTEILSLKYMCGKTLEEIARECERHGTLLFLDETLLELVDSEPEVSLIPRIADHPNVIIARSFTKSFAVPGIRVGYGISNPGIIAEMQKTRLPWNIGTMEQAAAAFMTDNFEFVEKAARELREEAPLMFRELKEAGLPLKKDTESFFHFMDLSPTGISVGDFIAEMKSKGFMVRDCASFGFPTYIRFCVKDRGRDSRFAKAVGETLAELKR